MKKAFQEFGQWCIGHSIIISQLTAFFVAIGLALVVIGNQRGTIAAIAESRPVLIAVIAAGPSLLTGLLISSRFRMPERWKDYRDVASISLIMFIAVATGVYLIGVAPAYADETLKSIAVRASIGWSLAYFAGGFGIGFLFGIPRVLQGDGNEGAGRPQNSRERMYEQRVNTNLEQISDWLTKIIVGLGLVELRSMPKRLYDAAAWMGQSISNKPQADQVASFCCAFIIFFSITGFLAGYLITRLFLAGAFWRADRQTIVLPPAGAQYALADTDANRLRAFWKTGPDAETKIKQWLQKEGINASVPLFLAGAEHQPARAKAVQELPINV
jgi:hypothetical protein